MWISDKISNCSVWVGQVIDDDNFDRIWLVNI